MFHRCENKENAIKLFRKLSKYLHPDAGGDNESFILLKESYDCFLQLHEFRKDKNDQPTKKPSGDPAKYQNSEFDVENGDEALLIIDEILMYAKKHKKFKTDYVDSLSEYLQEHGHITSSQYNKLVYIYYSFRMDKT